MSRNQPELIGNLLAAADDETQAEVLNEFVLCLGVFCKATQFSSVGMQAFYIAKRMRPATIDFFKEIIGSYEHLRQSLPADIESLQYDKDRLVQEIKDLQIQRDGLDG